MATLPLETRMAIHEKSTAGWSDPAIARAVGCSLSVVRKWRRRMKRLGVDGADGACPRMGRPRQGALSGPASWTRERLRALRTAHPGWGPDTLLAKLGLEQAALTAGAGDPVADSPAGAEPPLPHRSSVARWLHEDRLARAYERHSALPPGATLSARAAHEEWELDGRGYARIPAVGMVELINVNDVFSRVKLLSFPCFLGQQRVERHPDLADYPLVLRLAFTDWGLPDRLAVDHESVFHDNLSKSPFPTRFHLWLLALGIQVVFGRPGRPTDQGMTERSHQTWSHLALDGQQFADWPALFRALNVERTFLNEHLPCATLHHQPPLVAHAQARHPRRLYRPEHEAELIDLTRVYPYLASGQWFRRASNVGAVSLGGHVYVLGTAWARQQVIIHFDPTDQHLLFHAPEINAMTGQPIQNLSPSDLMGDLDPLARFPCLQLKLPFTWNDWRVLRLCETLPITT